MTPLAAAVFVTLIFIALAIPFVVRSIIWSRFINKMRKGDDQKALEILQSKMYKLMFGEYDQNWNILRVYISTGNRKMIEKQTQVLFDMKLSSRQAYRVASQTYFYFLDARNAQLSQRLLEKIKAYADEDEIQYSEMLFRILIEEKSQDIDFISNMLEQKKNETVKKDEIEDHQYNIGLLQYLLALQYSYLNDKDNMELYARQAKANLKNTPYARRAKQLLSHK